MSDTILHHHSNTPIGSREISSLRFADNIDLIRGSNDEPQQLSIVYQK